MMNESLVRENNSLSTILIAKLCKLTFCMFTCTRQKLVASIKYVILCILNDTKVKTFVPDTIIRVLITKTMLKINNIIIRTI